MKAEKGAARPAEPPRGRLVALDATRALDLRKSASQLQRRLASGKVPVGVSWWDASGVFFEMGLGKRKHRTASARTLVLLYASDLVFRLRWEIRPALAAGQTVIAAPYLGAAFAFGRANGLSRDWLTTLFRFAPEADDSYLARERKKSEGWKGDRREGFAEFSSAVLADTESSFDPVALRLEMIALLDASGRRARSRRLT
jgi:hypothetical protein